VNYFPDWSIPLTPRHPDDAQNPGRDFELEPYYPRRVRAVRTPVAAAIPAQDTGGVVVAMTAINMALHSMHRWWKLALPVGLVLGAGAASYVWSQFVPMFQAEATLLIQSRPQYVAFSGADGLSTTTETQLAILKMPEVLDNAIKRLGKISDYTPNSEPRIWLKNGLSIVRDGRSELFNVRFQHAEPAKAKSIVSAVIDSYLDFIKTLDQKDTKAVIDLLRKAERDRKTRIDGLKDGLKALTGEHSANDPSGSISGNLRLHQSLHERLMEQLAQIDYEEKVLQVKLQVQEATVAEDTDSLVPTAEMVAQVEADPRVQALKGVILDNQTSLENLKTKFSNPDEQPSYRRWKKDLQRAEEALAKIRQSVFQSLQQTAAAESQLKHANTIEGLKLELQSFDTRRKVLENQLDEEKKKLRQRGGEKVDLEFQRAELAQHQRVLDLISRRVVSLETEMDAPPRFNLMTPASAPHTPVEKIPTKKLFTAAAAGIAFPFCLAILWEHTRRRVGDTSQLRKSNVRVVGEVAALPGSTGLAPSRSSRQQSLFEESVHSLCTRLRLSPDLRNTQVLGVCSAVSGEGKTSLASQVALSLVRSVGQPTLLIDADMRSPDIHQIFEISNSQGLAQILTQDKTFEETVVKKSDVFHLLPAGRLVGSPHRLLGNDLFANMIKELRKTYSFIVIDCPPLLSSSESLVLAAAADASLVCARRNYSRTGQVSEAYRRLVEADANPIGVVLTGVPLWSYQSEYGRYPTKEE
jgi:capsular exopolysaccharide synthesis family protein